MTDPTNRTTDPTMDRGTTPGEPADETYGWTQTGPGKGPEAAASDGSTAATNIIDSIREAVEDLADRAGPTVRQISAKAAEIAAVAADKAAPLARRAGEATADASGKLAEKSRTWAAEVRETLGGDDAPASASESGADPAADAAADDGNEIKGA
ncbi:MAG: hypothetical protein ABIP77_03455 [Candidatus Limnocylindrales bacterium]